MTHAGVMPNPHFASADSWQAASAMLTFQPFVPLVPSDLPPPSLRIHVRDHKMRELAPAERSLEAHYGSFVFSQSRHDTAEARRRALSVSYGRDPKEALIGGREARLYELGPEVPPDDIDGRAPSVVVWHDDGMLLLIASGTMPVAGLMEIAVSMYGGSRGSK